jgi:hypothetical protein
MKSGLLAMLATVALLGSAASNATLVQSTTGERVTFRDCIPGATACDNLGPILVQTFGGNPGDLAATASQSSASFGSVSGSAQLPGPSGAPVLSGSAQSEVGKRVSTNSAALQRYTYTGATTTTRTFNGALSYSQTVPAGNAGFPSISASGVFAQLEIFTVSGSALDAGTTTQDNFNLLLGGFAGEIGYLALSDDSFQDNATNATGNHLLGVSVTLNPGDSVWVWALLQTPVANGAEVSFGNLVTGWDNTEGLTAANAIPEPGTLALVGLSLAALGWGRRRRA